MTIDEARALKKGTVVIVKTPWGSDQEPLLFDHWNEEEKALMVWQVSALGAGAANMKAWPIGYETARVGE